MEDHRTKLKDMDVTIYSHEEVMSGKLMRGRLVIDPAQQQMTVVQNAPRPYRSKEIGRGVYSRCVVRPDGNFTITLHLPAVMKYRLEQLLAEARRINDIIQHQSREE